MIPGVPIRGISYSLLTGVAQEEATQQKKDEDRRSGKARCRLSLISHIVTRRCCEVYTRHDLRRTYTETWRAIIEGAKP